jgi:hypothetical protein
MLEQDKIMGDYQYFRNEEEVRTANLSVVTAQTSDQLIQVS